MDGTGMIKRENGLGQTFHKITRTHQNNRIQNTRQDLDGCFFASISEIQKRGVVSTHGQGAAADPARIEPFFLIFVHPTRTYTKPGHNKVLAFLIPKSDRWAEPIPQAESFIKDFRGIKTSVRTGIYSTVP